MATSLSYDDNRSNAEKSLVAVQKYSFEFKIGKKNFSIFL